MTGKCLCDYRIFCFVHSAEALLCFAGTDLLSSDTVVWIPMTNIDRSKPSRGKASVFGFSKPATTVDKITSITKALNPSRESAGAATIFAFVIEQMMPPVQLGVLGMVSALP